MSSNRLLVEGIAATTSRARTGVTTSSNSSQSVSAASQAKGKTSQTEAVVTNTPSAPISSSGKGILAYTNGDLQANVVGATLMKFGAGHVTEVTTADAKYTVPAGLYAISAENGVSIKAGEGGTPANLSLFASYYIKQEALGPLSEITYGNSEKRTIGNAMEFFLGTKFTCLIGAEITLKFSLVISMWMGIAINIKILFEFTLNAAASITIKFLMENKLTIGNKLEIIVGSDFKQVTGTSTKIVVGPDQKMALSDVKFLATTDTKFVPGTDFKIVGNNYTLCGVDVKVTAADIDKGNLTIQQKALMAHSESITAKVGSLDVKSKAAVIFG